MSFYTKYINYIDSFINEDITKWNFKSHPSYCEVLEHVSKYYGDKYYQEIINRFNILYNDNKSYFIDLCKKNDLYGNTHTYDFNDFTKCSPTNLRYILHSLLILTHIKECSLTGVDIIEIGGGYGGLCFYMYKLAHLFGITINSYSIFDLKQPLLLQEKYLQHLGISGVNFVELDNIKNLKNNSFLISNYAFSEIDMDLQKKYKDNVLNPFVSHGFLAWNFIQVYNFIDNKDIKKEVEYPLTHPTNYYVRF